ncbi:MAG: helix-turn-helix domain-containing protein [Lachnospiraceae bacterium]|nr:helix-turn-helix domain-containing protein [Lachnospiraceae bacterium]
MIFSEEIKKIRKKALLSQEDFAKELGVSYSTVNRWETGKTLPNYKTMKRIDTFCKNNGIDFAITDE